MSFDEQLRLPKVTPRHLRRASKSGDLVFCSPKPGQNIDETAGSATVENNNKISFKLDHRPDFSSNSSVSSALSSAGFDIDEWQLLEMDEHQTNCATEAKSTTKDANDLDEANSLISNPSSIEPTNEVTPKATKYVQIDPLKQLQLAGQFNYNPLLTFICTAIYSLVPLASVLATFGLFILLFTNLYYLTILYYACVFLDRNTSKIGGRRIEWVHKSRFWSHLAAYFPVRIRYPIGFKLNPQNNYILNYTPHGIAAFGSVTALATDGLNLSKLLPGIVTRFMVHGTSFFVPVMRETFSLRGDCSVDSKSIDYCLTKLGTGNLLVIVVGGLAEADLSDQKTLKVLVANRKGFIKKAIVHGAHLVPCISFGENSVFHKVNHAPKSLMRRLEDWWYELFKFKHPIYYGRSIFSSRLTGLMPYQRPITVVFGEPIPVERRIQPNDSEIDDLHSEYLERLQTLYADNADLCMTYDTTMVLV